jgi:arylsulfatase A-like enzyme
MSDVSRRDFLKTAAASAAGAAGAAVLGARAAFADEPQRRANLVFVFPDQYRGQALGFMKQDPVITPRLDRFASQSRVFTNAVSNRPLCSPYRAMLMTGRWPYATGVTTNCNSSRPNTFLKEDEVCFSDVLNRAGYDVGYIGKWHLDAPQGVPVAKDWRKAVWDAYNPPGPRRHGFTFWHAYGCSNNHLKPHYWIGDAKKDEKTYFDEYSPEHEAKVASEFILNPGGKARDAKKPFALFVSMNPPHPPFDKVPDTYRRMYAGRTPDDLLVRPNVRRTGAGKRAPRAVRDYFAAVTGVDAAFGKILDAIRDAGEEKSTIVVFSADHGEMMGSHGKMSKVAWYEESLCIPFIMRFPGKVKPGRDDLHINVPDCMPTLLSMMGMGERIPKRVEGTDHARLIRAGAGERPASTFYLNSTDSPDRGARGVRTGRYTYIVQKKPNETAEFVYDRTRDPYQLNGRPADVPSGVRDGLRSELNGWLSKTNDPWKAV